MLAVGNGIVRTGEARDLEQLTALYNHYVVHTAITFDIEPIRVEDRRRDWFSTFGLDGAHRLFVAEDDGVVVGYACSAPFRPKPAYARSVQTSVYCDPEVVGRGIGTMLYDRLLDELSGCGLHRVMAGITLPNEASVRLHQRFGFTEIGIEHEVGWKFGRYWDVLRLERGLD